jgi:sulfate transport system permease protein
MRCPGIFPGKARTRVLPGFGLTLGFTILYLSLMVLLPAAALLQTTMSMDWAEFWAAVSAPRVMAALKLSFGAALLAALVNVFLGFLVAWTLVRYRFPGRRLAEALVDLPFALPTSVAGIALTSILASNGWIGRFFAPLGVELAFNRTGIVIALVFIGLPFVVRTVQPVLAESERSLEEAAACLGATRWETFYRVILPLVFPAVLTGFAMALARGIGEYGSIVFISSNIPMLSEIAPQVIAGKLNEFDTDGAAATAVVMLAVSLLLLLCINSLQFRQHRRSATAKKTGAA